MELRETGRTEKKKRNETSIERRRRATRRTGYGRAGSTPSSVSPASASARRCSPRPFSRQFLMSSSTTSPVPPPYTAPGVVSQRRAMQRRVLVVVHGADVGSREQELVHRARVPEATRDQQRGDPAFRSRPAPRSMSASSSPAVPLPGRVEQRAASELIGRVNVRARAEERVDDGAVSVQRRED